MIWLLCHGKTDFCISICCCDCLRDNCRVFVFSEVGVGGLFFKPLRTLTWHHMCLRACVCVLIRGGVDRDVLWILSASLPLSCWHPRSGLSRSAHTHTHTADLAPPSLLCARHCFKMSLVLSPNKGQLTEADCVATYIASLICVLHKWHCVCCAVVFFRCTVDQYFSLVVKTPCPARLGVSLPQHTWFKRAGCYQASAEFC